MIVNYTYYKNSNTGLMIMEQSFRSSDILFKPDDIYYDLNGEVIEVNSLVGFVEITKKKFDREKRKTQKRVNFDKIKNYG